jgi:predicted DNA-binding transcriptional regulator AlpA
MLSVGWRNWVSVSNSWLPGGRRRLPVPDTLPQHNPNPDSAPTVESLRARPNGATPKALLTAAIEPLLVDTEQAAAVCGIGRATWFRLRSADKTPAPVRLGGRVLYRVEDLKLWAALGCPSRKEFEARKEAVNASSRPR